MVKQAERIKKRSPLTPIMGLIIAVGLGVVAALLIDPVTSALPPLRTALLSSGTNYDLMRALIGFVLWLLMCGVGYFLVAILAGEDPTSAKKIPLRPRNVKKRN